jgi:D-glycero-alpha-D-manno-heptose-7-phosphate kinase
MIVARSPYRISLFGGGTDIPEYFNKKGGIVISTTINKYCYVTFKDLLKFYEHKYLISWSKLERKNSIFEIEHPTIKNILSYFNYTNGLEIHHTGDLPARSGMGSSSAFAVAIVHLFYHKLQIKSHDFKSEVAKLAFHIERNMNNEFVGMQDQLASSYGGFNSIEFSSSDNKNIFKVNPINIDNDYLRYLESGMVLLYLGTTRSASDIEIEKFKDKSSYESKLDEIKDIAHLGLNLILKESAIKDIGELLDNSWLIKRSLSSSVSNNKIDEFFVYAKKAGALGSKLLGAGGGGFVLCLVEKSKRNDFIRKIKLLNIDFKFDFSGSQIINFN